MPMVMTTLDLVTPDLGLNSDHHIWDTVRTYLREILAGILVGIPAYSFMDVLGQRVKEEDIWFCAAMAIKGQKNEMAVAAFNAHQKKKARR